MVELLGELVMQLTDHQPMEIIEIGAKPKEDSPLALLPAEEQHRILASLYIARSDMSLGVQQAAQAVWKTIVSNTPKALRVILPTLTELLLQGPTVDGK